MGLRDIALIGFIVLVAIYALRYPWVGVMLWTWISIMNPHQQLAWATGSMPVAQIAALTTLIGLVFTKDRRNPLDRPAAWMLLAWTAWMTIGLPFSFYVQPSIGLWERSMKIFLMIFVTIALIDNKRKLDWFIWICTFSLAYYGIKGGVFTILHGGSYRVWGPGGFVGGNNEIALALIMITPLIHYLQLQLKNRWLRWMMAGSMLLCVAAAAGSHSRGAFLALFAMGAFLWLKTPNKIFSGVGIVIGAMLVLSVMPEAWWDRMESIRDYKEDASATGRLNAWWFSWNVAKDNFFGAGFMPYFPDAFARYAPEPDRIHAAHSIYFQAMGEHGFIGLFLFMSIGALTWLEARKLIKLGKQNPEELLWCRDLGRMIQVSMVGYASGGAFLSLAYFDLPYNVMVMAVCAMYIARKTVAAKVKVPKVPPALSSAPVHGAPGGLPALPQAR
jgi:putative inorganic carbon (hco3(-)) transporter